MNNTTKKSIVSSACPSIEQLDSGESRLRDEFSRRKESKNSSDSGAV